MTDRTPPDPPDLAPGAAGLTPLALRLLPKAPTGMDAPARPRAPRPAPSQYSASCPTLPQAEAAALAALARQGDKAATGRLIALYTPLIRRIIRYVPLQDRPDAQADCHLALIQALRRYDPAYGMDLTGYLSLELRRHFRNSLRRTQTRTEITSPNAEIDNFPDLRNDFEGVVRRRALDAARDALTPDEAACIHFLYDRDLSYTQTAQIMGINETRIDYLRKIALRKLRRHLEAGDLDESLL